MHIKTCTHSMGMFEFTFYWENTDIGAPYFYVELQVHEQRINDLDSHLAAQEFTFPLPAESIQDIEKASPKSIMQYCGEASFQEVQSRIPKYLKGPLAEAFKRIRAQPQQSAKKPSKLENIVIPDVLPDDVI